MQHLLLLLFLSPLTLAAFGDVTHNDPSEADFFTAFSSFTDFQKSLYKSQPTTICTTTSTQLAWGRDKECALLLPLWESEESWKEKMGEWGMEFGPEDTDNEEAWKLDVGVRGTCMYYGDFARFKSARECWARACAKDEAGRFEREKWAYEVWSYAARECPGLLSDYKRIAEGGYTYTPYPIDDWRTTVTVDSEVTPTPRTVIVPPWSLPTAAFDFATRIPDAKEISMPTPTSTDKPSGGALGRRMGTGVGFV